MTNYETALVKHLQEFLTQPRQAKFEEILEKRTRILTVVLVDLYQEHNASAILRSCEAFGVQDIHVVESENKFLTKPEIAMGTDRWLSIHRFGGKNGLRKCFSKLKKKGFRTAATVLNHESQPIQDVEVSRTEPLALFYGNEKQGLPQTVIDQADFCIHIPMHGFVESFNVSVAAALSLQTLTEKIRRSSTDWHLGEKDREGIWLDWTRRTIPNCEAIERRFQKEWESTNSSRSQPQ